MLRFDNFQNLFSQIYFFVGEARHEWEKIDYPGKECQYVAKKGRKECFLCSHLHHNAKPAQFISSRGFVVSEFGSSIRCHLDSYS